MKKIKNLIFGVSLFYLGLYIPIALMTYFPVWYILCCKLHPNCDYIGYPLALKYIDELTDFFLHLNPLSNEWTGKEKLHLAEVRNILDFLVIIAIIAIILLVFFFNRNRISTYALINFIIILFLLLLLPFFKAFWIKIFHPLIFNNNLWRNNYLDRSYYIMPRDFFKYSLIFLIAFSSLFNGLLWFSFKRPASGKNM